VRGIGNPTKLVHFLARALVAWVFASVVLVVLVYHGPVGIAP
jgi:hypothetical protein